MDQNKTPFLEIITAGFSAGEVKTFVLAGGYFELIDAPYPVTVRLVDRYGTLRGYMTQAEASFYMRQGEFDAIEIISPNAQTIRFAYGSSESGTRRTSGVVQVIDGEQVRSLAGVAFSSGNSVPGVTGQFPYCQIWNPAGSNKNLVVQQISLSSDLSGHFYVFFEQTPRPNYPGNLNFSSKKAGGVLGVGEPRNGNSAVSPPTSIFSGHLASGIINTWTPKGGLLLPPGYGLTAGLWVSAASLFVNAEWFEVQI